MKLNSVCLLAFLFILLLSATVYSQKYSVSNIPKELLKNSNAVIREQTEEFTIVSAKETRLKGKMVVTVLNDAAKDWGHVFLPYDKFSKVDKIRAVIYDERGEQEIKMKQSDIFDRGSLGFSLYDDNRVKIFDPQYKRYPFTLEYEYEYTYKGSLFYPEWIPQPAAKISVELAKFKVVSPAKIPFRYRLTNINKPDSLLVENLWNYQWSVSNLKAKEKEPFGLPFNQTVPSVTTAPIDFELDGYPGKMDTWQNFSKWISDLNKDRDKLDARTIEDLEKIIYPTDPPEVKVRKVYEYLQFKTRYVSIQLGIGGFQPFPANVVGETGYGDCKALSNYTKAMLNNIGINSYYTLVRAGENAPGLKKEFPSSQFNHAFLCVPLDKDTIWLECTSQTNPFGYLGTFTGGREVLLITEEGGKVVKTPNYRQEDNLKSRKVSVDLKDGNAFLKVTTQYKGLQFEDHNLNFMVYESKEDQKQWLYGKTKLSNFVINSFGFDIVKDRIPSATERLEISITNFWSPSSKRMFFYPNILNRLNIEVPNYQSRTSDVWVSQSFIEIDTVEYSFSSNYYLDYNPENVEIKSEFGSYEVHFSNDENKVVYIRKFSLNKNVYSKEKYLDFAKFIRKVKQSDNLKLALVAKT